MAPVSNQVMHCLGSTLCVGRKIGDEPALICALAHIKKVAAQSNGKLGILSELIDGQHHDQFIIDCYEGSGGTSNNMNAN